jgi:peptidoglycan/LPS O-acetylase OafA/YrhL
MRGISKSGFVNLNVIRALSGLVVVVSHYFQLFVMPVAGRSGPINVAIRASDPAVLTFFVLSGLLIALSIQRNIQQNGYFDWKAYAISRIARIYPALVASVVLCLLLRCLLVWLGHGGPMALQRATDVYPVGHAGFVINRSEIFWTLMQTYAFGPGTYLGVNGPLWSLSYEVGFYLAAGLLVTVVKGKGMARGVAAGALVALVLCSVVFRKHLFLHYGTIWVLGVALFFVLNARSATSGAGRRVGYFATLFAACTLTNVVLLVAGFAGDFIHEYLWATLILLLLYLLSRTSRVILGRIGNMADSTYTLYLFHFPPLLFLYAFIRDVHETAPVLYFGAAFVFTLALIPACHRLAKRLEDRRAWEALLSQRRRPGRAPIVATVALPTRTASSDGKNERA